MNARNPAALVLKVIILAVILYVLHTIDFIGLEISTDAWTAPLPWLLMALLQTIVLAYVILRSRWSGWTLAATVFLVMYGIMTFQTGIEAVVFLQDFQEHMPEQDTPGLFVNGAFLSAIFAIAAVWILGKWKPSGEPPEPNRRLVMKWYHWVWKLPLVSFIYLVVYILFGALVFQPLAGEAFEEFYGNVELPAWMLPFQMLRGLIWAIIAMPVIRMTKGRWWEAGWAVALLFMALMGFLLIPPNEYMPDAIRYPHLIEVSSENFIFGWIAVLMLNRRD